MLALFQHHQHKGHRCPQSQRLRDGSTAIPQKNHNFKPLGSIGQELHQAASCCFPGLCFFCWGDDLILDFFGNGSWVGQAAVASVAVELPPRAIQVSEDEVEVGNEVGSWSC